MGFFIETEATQYVGAKGLRRVWLFQDTFGNKRLHKALLFYTVQVQEIAVYLNSIEAAAVPMFGVNPAWCVHTALPTETKHASLSDQKIALQKVISYAKPPGPRAQAIARRYGDRCLPRGSVGCQHTGFNVVVRCRWLLKVSICLYNTRLC